MRHLWTSEMTNLSKWIILVAFVQLCYAREKSHAYSYICLWGLDKVVELENEGTRLCKEQELMSKWTGSISILLKVKMPRQLNCIPFKVAVKFKLILLYKPELLHSFGGLHIRQSHYMYPRANQLNIYKLNNCHTTKY